MNGLLYVEATEVEASSGRMLVTFQSGGDAFRFYIPADVALLFRQRVLEDAWQVCCAPNAEVITLKPKRRRK
jgi:hypothetical protein